MTSAIIFILYLVLFSWIITRVKFFTDSGIPKLWLIIFFNLKIAAGLAYAWFYSQPQYYATSDTWSFFNQGCAETDVLINDPIHFFKDLFYHGYESTGDLFGSTQSYWNNLKTNVVIKLVAIFNVFTIKNYYANIILFNFLFFFGPVALFRLLNKHMHSKKWITAGLVFCIPSFLFWYSGAHKDGLIFSSFLLTVYSIDKIIITRKLKYVLSIFLNLLVLFALRNYFILLLIPAVIAWLLSKKYPNQKFLIVSMVYGFCLLLILISPMFGNEMNMLQYLQTKQAEFIGLGGNSQVILPTLQPNTQGFFRFLPNALDMAFLRPHLNEYETLAYLPAIIENVFLLLAFLFYAYKYFNSPSKKFSPPLIVFFLCFSISLLLLLGYTVTLTGAIVRYRAFVLPLITTSLLSLYYPERK